MTFLASWCPYCRSETPYLVAAAHHFGHRVTILGVDVDEKRLRAVHYAQTSHVSFPVLLDRTGRVATRFDVVELPTTVFVNAQGRIIRVKAGAFMSRVAVTRMIQYLLLSSRTHHLQHRSSRHPLRH